MKWNALAALGAFFLLASGVRGGPIITLGQKDFSDGDFPSLTTYNNAQVGEPNPFDGFKGSDLVSGVTFNLSWTFTFPIDVYPSATVTVGLSDHDSAAPGSQAQSFTMDGNNLTAALSALMDSHGGSQVEYNTYTVDIPAGALPALADGSATFNLILQPPGLQGTAGTTNSTISGNGAGLDFSTLALPEPASWTLISVVGAFALRRRRGSVG